MTDTSNPIVSKGLNNFDKYDNFKKLEKLGEGVFSVVYKVKDPDGKIYAFKRYRSSFDDDDDEIEKFKKHKDSPSFAKYLPTHVNSEYNILSKLDHPYIVKCYGIEYKFDRFGLYFDIMKSNLTEFIKNIFGQILQAVEYIHANNIIHTDLKLQNILIGEDMNIKLCDFNTSMEREDLQIYIYDLQTLWYRSPELLLGKHNDYPDTPIDIWSLGCIFYELVTGKVLFCGDSAIDQVFRIFQVLGTPCVGDDSNMTGRPWFKPTFPMWKRDIEYLSSKMDKIELDLLLQLLIYNPSKRITATQALQHEYFQI